MRTVLLGLALGFVACDGDDGNDTDNDTSVGDETPEEITERKFAELVTVTDAPVAGESACFTPGGDFLDQTVDPAKQISETRAFTAADFQTGATVDGATINVYEGNDVTAAADSTVVTDENGDAQVTIDSCTPFAVQVSKDGTKNTYQNHVVLETVADNDDGEMNSVSDATYSLIPSLYGVSIDDDKSVIAGAFYDCNGDPIENAQVVVRDMDGNIPDSLLVNYFVESFPDRAQPATSADGLWIAMNLPEGDWVAEAYVSDGAGGHDLVGTATVTNFADTIGIGSIYWGVDGGVWYPPSCLAPEEAR